MYFVSVEKNAVAGVVSRNKGKSFGLELTPEMLSGEGIKGDFVVEDDILKWKDGVVGFGSHGVDDEEWYPKNIKKSDVIDSEENPILYVLCSEIKLYSGIPAVVKLLRVNNDMFIAALITGACQINGVPLQRCNNSNLDILKTGEALNVKTLYGDCSSLGKVMGNKGTVAIDYSYDVLCQGRLLWKDGDGRSIRSDSAREYVFDNRHKEACEKRIADENVRLEHEKEIKRKKAEEEKAKYEKMRAEKEQREREEREALADMKKNGHKVEKGTKVVNVGASDFLKAVMAISGK